MSICIECEHQLVVPTDAVEGEVLRCQGCDVELEVIGLAPIELALAPEVDEDWGE